MNTRINRYRRNGWRDVWIGSFLLASAINAVIAVCEWVPVILCLPITIAAVWMFLAARRKLANASKMLSQARMAETAEYYRSPEQIKL